jgi:DNA-binding transcriptional ArsR family regulator
LIASARARDDQLDLVFHALGNRTRRAILRTLSKGPAIITELAAPHGMSFNAISKHLMVLERAGLVHRTVSGRVHSLALRAGPMASAQEWLGAYSDFWSDKLDRFAAFVERDSKR